MFLQVALLKERVKEIEQELKQEIQDKNVLKEKAENLTKEYDRLTNEHCKLQAQILSSGDKKDL